MKLDTKNRYAFADGLRGLAALWVVLYHLLHGDHVTQLSNFIGPALTAILFEYGNLGVPVFFVLSGFVMAVTTNSKTMGLSQSSKFMLRRLVRLSPPYYFSILLSLIAIYVKLRFVDDSIEFPNFANIISHFFYLQEFLGYKEINIVFWTLCYEIQFYLAFSLILFLASNFNQKSLGHHLVLVGFTLLGLLWFIFHQYAGALDAFVNSHKLFLRYWYAFCAGALAGWAITRKHQAFQTYAIFFYVLTLLAGVLKSDPFAITAGITALSIHIALQFNKMDSWLNFRYLQLLGLISYSLYLIHNILLGIVARVVRKFLSSGVVTDIVVLITCLAACLLFAYWMYVIIEKPVIRISQKIKY
jgi:peptidoglycan/LPS O-acetylase OafA/YrhL